MREEKTQTVLVTGDREFDASTVSVSAFLQKSARTSIGGQTFVSERWLKEDVETEIIFSFNFQDLQNTTK